jgi:hypothetical protein
MNDISLVLVYRGRGGEGRRNSSGGGGGVERAKGGGHTPTPSTSWAENTIMTECAQDSGHLQSTVYSLICGSLNYP